MQTARSAFTLDGRVNTDTKPTSLDLRVTRAAFAFQEWSGVLRGLRNIAVEAAFDTSLKGPVNQLDDRPAADRHRRRGARDTSRSTRRCRAGTAPAPSTSRG